MRACLFKINLSLKEAIQSYYRWMNQSIEVQVDENDHYHDGSIQISETEDGWTCFIDHAGEAFFGLPNEEWLKLAAGKSVTYAYYDEDLNAELIVIENGVVIREFLLYEDEPDDNVNCGSLTYEATSPITDWHDVVVFLEQEITIL